MNLILLEPAEGADAGDVVVSDRRAAHMIDVLKVAPGHQVRVGIVDGPFGLGTVKEVSEVDRRILLQCEFEAVAPPRPRVDLLLALPRPKVLRRLWAQLAALGVGRIVLTNAARVERDYWATHILAPAYYRPLLIEGLEQARDTRLPLVSMHRRFRVFVEDELDTLAGMQTRLVAHPGEATPVDRAVPGAGDRVLLAVGPEGGWNDFELTLLERHGFRRVGIGERTLRTDTACVALLALAHAAIDRPTVPWSGA